MTLSQLALSEPEKFAKLVKELRALGVVAIEGDKLLLGELPRPTELAKREPRDPRAKAEQDRDVLFAATRFRPSLPEQSVESNVPKAIVQRRERNGARNGGQGTAG